MDALYDPWSTHIPALALAVHRFGPRVLEIGCGWYSTPLLHTMSNQVQTIETDEIWAKKFNSVTNGKLTMVPDVLGGASAFCEFPWDVVFVDCDPVSLRVACVELFLNRKCCVVAHDTEAPNYAPLLPTVKYVRHFDFNLPRTSFLSNTVDVTATFIEFYNSRAVDVTQ